MHHKNVYFLPGLLLLIFAVPACTPGSQQPLSPVQELYAKFQPMVPADTLPIRLDTVPGMAGTELRAPLLVAAVDAMLMSNMLYEVDTSDFHGQVYWRIPLDENHEACLIGITQVWFGFKYLLIYSRSAEQFVDLVPAAYLYGGDGSQAIRESWIFDLKSEPTLLIRDLEHALRWSETDPEEMEDINVQSAGMMRFSQGRFQEIPVRDSSRWIRMYPLSWGE